MILIIKYKVIMVTAAKPKKCKKKKSFFFLVLIHKLKSLFLFMSKLKNSWSVLENKAVSINVGTIYEGRTGYTGCNVGLWYGHNVLYGIFNTFQVQVRALMEGLASWPWANLSARRRTGQHRLKSYKKPKNYFAPLRMRISIKPTSKCSSVAER